MKLHTPEAAAAIVPPLYRASLHILRLQILRLHTLRLHTLRLQMPPPDTPEEAMMQQRPFFFVFVSARRISYRESEHQKWCIEGSVAGPLLPLTSREAPLWR
jgi:hypothetical protein